MFTRNIDPMPPELVSEGFKYLRSPQYSPLNDLKARRKWIRNFQTHDLEPFSSSDFSPAPGWRRSRGGTSMSWFRRLFRSTLPAFLMLPYPNSAASKAFQTLEQHSDGYIYVCMSYISGSTRFQDLVCVLSLPESGFAAKKYRTVFSESKSPGT